MWWWVHSIQMNAVFVLHGHTCRKAWMNESLHLLLRSDILSGNEFHPDLKGSPGVISVQQHKQCMVSYHLLCTKVYISQQLENVFFFFQQMVLSRLPGRFGSKLLLQLEFKSKLCHLYSIEVARKKLSLIISIKFRNAALSNPQLPSQSCLGSFSLNRQ